MLPEQNKRTVLLALWATSICCVVVGSLLPAASPVMAVVGRLHVSDKVMHFGAYLILSSLPVISFRDRRSGIVAGLSMFVLGVLLEAGQHFSPGRAVEFADVVANGMGVGCGVLLAPPIRGRA
jgi:VanZ family protein